MFTANPKVSTKLAISTCLFTPLPVSKNPLPIKMNPTYMKGAKLPAWQVRKIMKAQQVKSDARINNTRVREGVARWRRTAHSKAIANGGTASGRAGSFGMMSRLTGTFLPSSRRETRASADSSIQRPSRNTNPAAPMGLGGFAFLSEATQAAMIVNRFKGRQPKAEPESGEEDTILGFDASELTDQALDTLRSSERILKKSQSKVRARARPGRISIELSIPEPFHSSRRPPCHDSLASEAPLPLPSTARQTAAPSHAPFAG